MDYKYIQKVAKTYDVMYSKLRVLEENKQEAIKRNRFDQNAEEVIKIDKTIDKTNKDKEDFKEQIKNIFDADNEVAIEVVNLLEQEMHDRSVLISQKMNLKEFKEVYDKAHELSIKTINNIEERTNDKKTEMLKYYRNVNNIIEQYVSKDNAFKFQCTLENVLEITSQLREEHKDYMIQWQENMQERLKNHGDLNSEKQAEMSEQNRNALRSSNQHLRAQYVYNEEQENVLSFKGEKEYVLKDAIGSGTYDRYWKRLEDTLHIVGGYETISKDYSYINAVGVLNVRENNNIENIVQVKCPIRYYPDVNGKEKFYARRDDYEKYVKTVGEPTCAIEEEVLSREHKSINSLSNARSMSQWVEKYNLTFRNGTPMEEIEEKITKIIEDNGPHSVLDLLDHIDRFVKPIKEGDPRTTRECLENIQNAVNYLKNFDIERDLSINEEKEFGVDRIHTRSYHDR